MLAHKRYQFSIKLTQIFHKQLIAVSRFSPVLLIMGHLRSVDGILILSKILVIQLILKNLVIFLFFLLVCRSYGRSENTLSVHLDNIENMLWSHLLQIFLMTLNQICQVEPSNQELSLPISTVFFFATKFWRHLRIKFFINFFA